VLTNDGLVFSVGYNSNGEQGTDSGMTVPFYTHMNLFHGRSVKEIYAGDFMSMFRTDDDKIHCCGCNERGSMGIGITAATFAIREMKVLDTRFGVYDEPAHVKSIFVGGYHRFLVTDNNVVFAAGFNSEGECFVEGNDVMVYAKSNVLTEFANMQPSKELVIGSTFGFSVALLIRMLLLKLLTHKSK
jgi:alpha-tubulin suppressor-like RCC1 family protein